MGYFLSLPKVGAESSLNWSEIALLVFGALLVAGLVGEYRTPEQSQWYKRFEMFVIIGVLGELLADGAIFAFTSRLETLNALEVAALNQEAAKANDRAGQAVDRAARLEALLANRRLTPEQQRAIAKALAKVSPQLVWLRSSPGDNEAKRIGLEIGSALRLAGIEVEDRLGFNSEAFVGIRIDCGSTDLSWRKFAEALRDALTIIGKLDISPFGPGACGGAPGEVFIGQKPLADPTAAK
jgi:hypothetical protein